MSGWAFQRAELKPSRTNPSSDPDPEFETIEIELIEYDPQSPQQMRKEVLGESQAPPARCKAILCRQGRPLREGELQS
jgi:hypothetical protein